jgi:hypothetical protein
MGSVLKRILGMVNPWASWLRYLICAWILLSLGLAILDPSASRGLDFFLRLLFWLAHVGGGIVILEAVQIALGKTALVDRLHPWAQVLLAGVIGAFFLTAFSFFVLDPLFARSGPEAGDDGFTLTEFVSEFRFSASAAVLFWLLLNGPRLLTIANQQETDRTLATSDPEDVQALKTEGRDNTELQQLLSKLPPSIGVDLVALSAELHYLRVYTVKGNALILMSFGKAIQAVMRVRGVAVHRSHWVAVDHIHEVQTQGGRVLCQMSTGLVLPVSRSGRAPLKLAVEELRLEQARRDAALLARRRSRDS